MMRNTYYGKAWLVWTALAIAGAGIAVFVFQYDQSMHADAKQRLLSILFGSLLCSAILIVAATSSWWMKR